MLQRCSHLTQSRGRLAAVALVGFAALPIGCGYQLGVAGTPTATPVAANTLHVRQIPSASGTQTAAAPASLIDQMVQRYLDSAGQGSGASADAAQPAAPTAAAAATSAATTPAPASPSLAANIGDPVARYAGPAIPPLTAAPALPAVTAEAVAPGDDKTSSNASRQSAAPPAVAAQPDAAPPPPPVPPAASAANGTTRSRTLTVAAPTAQVTAVSLAVTFPTGPAATPPSNSGSSAVSTSANAPATAAPATAAPTRVPPPAVPAAPKQPVVVMLGPGPNDIMYAGVQEPINQALAGIAGQYSVVYFTTPGVSQTYVYRPGVDAALTVPPGTWMRIVMNPGTSARLAMFPAN